MGIGDYTASRLSAPARSLGAAPGRRWKNLRGAVNDARAVRDVLVARYGFAAHEVRLLLDQDATRERILAEIEGHLIGPAGPRDHLVFFYAGHGSQVVNSKSGEPDDKDESLVPADSRLGAPDIRDKELRRLFHRALDRGARLTVILDSCHSGSGARGIPHERRARGVRLDPRDVADGADVGPPLEKGKAVILSAAQDFEQALESWDAEQRTWHGAFTQSLLRAVRMAARGEPAEALFRRIRAWLHGPEGMSQEPVLAGEPAALALPLLGESAGTGDHRPLAAVEAVDREGRILLQAGWIHGLAVGSELEAVADESGKRARRLRVTALQGLTHSQAEVVSTGVRTNGTSSEVPARSGELYALAGWAVPPGPPLEVWLPLAGEAQRQWALQVGEAAAEAGITLADDPTVGEGPTHVLSWHTRGWRLSGEDALEVPPGMEPARIVEELHQPGRLIRLFVELPVPTEIVTGIETALEGTKVKLTDDPARAEYFLAGRWHQGGLELAWVLPGTTSEDQARSLLPLRSRWHRLNPSNPQESSTVAEDLATDAAGLARVRAWLRLAEESPPGGGFPYSLALRAVEPEGAILTGGELVEDERYGLLLRARSQELTGPIARRFIYVFVIDSSGRCSLLYPPPGYGSVENRFPLESEPPYPTEIPLGPEPLFVISEPFGIDTYYLLTTREPIPNPGVLECPGVRGKRGGPYGSALEELLAETGSTSRGVETLTTPLHWSLERLTFRALPSGAEARDDTPGPESPGNIEHSYRITSNVTREGDHGSRLVPPR